jgi:hypothetical protein
VIPFSMPSPLPPPGIFGVVIVLALVTFFVNRTSLPLPPTATLHVAGVIGRDDCLKKMAAGTSSYASLHICMLCARSEPSETSTGGWAAPRSASVVAGGENKAAFDKIYRDVTWSAAGGGSGHGSDPAIAHGAGLVIQLVVYKYSMTSLLDAPCGAAADSWMKLLANKLRRDVPCFRYHGVDVVEDVIRRNAANFTDPPGQPWARFSALDLSGEPLPRAAPAPVASTITNSAVVSVAASANVSASGVAPTATVPTHLRRTTTTKATRATAKLPTGYELLLSRDALQHLNYRGIAGALATYCAATATYLLVGSYLDRDDTNKDLVTAGGCFSINLLAPPFSFPPPIETFAESGRPFLVDSGPMGASKGYFPKKFLLLYALAPLCKHANVTRFISAFGG